MTRGLHHYKKHLAIAAYIALFAIFVVAFAIAHTRYVDHKCPPAPTGDVQGEGNYVIQKTVSLDPHKDPVWISAFDTEMLQLEGNTLHPSLDANLDSGTGRRIRL